jgi:hypothetical protein
VEIVIGRMSYHGIMTGLTRKKDTQVLSQIGMESEVELTRRGY